MFTSIDENAFMKAIKDKDYIALKVSIVSTILADPTFERGETDEAIRRLKKQVPKIFEEEVKLEYEERLEREAWNKRYFTKLTYWLQKNFAESRIEYIKEVGSVVHRDTAEKYKQSINSIPGNKVITQNSHNPIFKRNKAENLKVGSFNTISSKVTREYEENKENFPVVGVLLAVGTLVLVGFLLFKLL